jgi:hypothetical protein
VYLSSLYIGLLAAFSAVIYIFYLEKILALSLPKQIAIAIVKFILNVVLAALVVSLVNGVAAINWMRIIYMALGMQILLPGILMARNYFKSR